MNYWKTFHTHRGKTSILISVNFSLVDILEYGIVSIITMACLTVPN